MSAILGRPVFEIGGVAYTWSDVIRAAEIRGEWADVRRRAASLYASAATADDVTGLDDHAAEFRQARNLASAEEMEAWLELWDLSEERWLDWVRADAIHARHRGAAPSPHDEPDESTVLTEAICSGELVRWADRLAERAVGWSATHPGDGQSAGLADLEASFRAYVQTIATEARLASQLALHRLEWTRVAFRRLTFPDRDQAREGLLALTDDQLSIDELARTARVTVVDRSTLLEDLPAAVADRLRGAPSATPVGPFEVDGGWVLLQVSSRTAPTMTDPQIAERARAEVVRSGLARDARDRIRWIWPR